MPSRFEHGVEWQVRCSSASNCLSCLDLENAGRKEFRSGVSRTKEVRDGYTFGCEYQTHSRAQGSL